MKKAGYRRLKIFRLIIALIIFIGVCTIYLDVKSSFSNSISKIFTSIQFVPSLLTVLSGEVWMGIGFFVLIILTLLFGRIYCSFICPLGTLQDFLNRMFNKWFGKRPNIRVGKWAKRFQYALLAILILSFFFMGSFLIGLFDPYAGFGRMLSSFVQPAFIFVNNVLAKILMHFDIYIIHLLPTKTFQWPVFIYSTVLLGIIVWFVFMGNRFYCNSVCPVGALLGLVSKVSLFKVRFRNEHCTSCGRCEKACKADAINSKDKIIHDEKCVMCYNCLLDEGCNQGAIELTKVKTLNKKEKIDIEKEGRREFLKYSLFTSGAFGFMDNTKANDHCSRHLLRTRRGMAPPGACSIENLKEYCISCQLCISVCPTKVLQPAYLEYSFTGMMMPRMDTKSGFCNYNCTSCGEVCPTEAIKKLSKETKQVTQVGRVEFRKHLCIVESENTACGSCSERCPTQAVKMVPYKNGLTIPEINPDICVGCGACEYACPVTDPHVAIFVLPNKEHKQIILPKDEPIENTQTDDFPF